MATERSKWCLPVELSRRWVEGQDAEPAEVVAEATDATAADVATDVKADVADKGADASKKSAKS